MRRTWTSIQDQARIWPPSMITAMSSMSAPWLLIIARLSLLFAKTGFSHPALLLDQLDPAVFQNDLLSDLSSNSRFSPSNFSNTIHEITRRHISGTHTQEYVRQELIHCPPGFLPPAGGEVTIVWHGNRRIRSLSWHVQEYDGGPINVVGIEIPEDRGFRGSHSIRMGPRTTRKAWMDVWPIAFQRLPDTVVRHFDVWILILGSFPGVQVI